MEDPENRTVGRLGAQAEPGRLLAGRIESQNLRRREVADGERGPAGLGALAAPARARGAHDWAGLLGRHRHGRRRVGIDSFGSDLIGSDLIGSDIELCRATPVMAVF